MTEAKGTYISGTQVLFKDKAARDMISQEYKPAETYYTGYMCIYEGKLYKATKETTGSWDETAWEETRVEKINNIGLADLKAEFLNVAYPVGSIYMSVNSTSPATLFGGTWEQLKDRFLVGAGSGYAANATGGSSTHSHLYGLKMGGYFGETALAESTNAGLVHYAANNATSIKTIKSGSTSSLDHTLNSSVTGSSTTKGCTTYTQTANASYASTLPPYLAVYIWKRTA